MLSEGIVEIENTNSELIDDYDFDECNYKYFTPEEKEEQLKKII